MKEVLLGHWNKFGRNFFTRYDYEGCDSESANKVMQQLKDLFKQADFVGRQLNYGDKSYEVKLADDFQYTDPIDNVVTKNQV